MTSSIWLCVLLAVIISMSGDTEAVRFRCGILSFLGNDRACRASCWITGQKTGKCDTDGNCNCSEEDLNISESVNNLLGGLDVLEYVQLKYDSFVEEINSWSITDKIKEMVPSRCSLGDDFCVATCHGIGRVTGKCNAAKSDCDCSDELVSARQYALCVEDGICSMYCQRKGLARGECRGDKGWDCMCVSNKGNLEQAPFDERSAVEFP